VTAGVIVVVAGVSGSGKTTVGTLLAARMAAEFADGDTFHPAANVAKMRAGIPLTDADRRPWLHAIEAWMDQRIAAGTSAVVACSALHRAYRDELRRGRPSVRIVFLQISREMVAARLAARHGHFFPASLLDSQFGDLEPPDPAEPVLVADARPGLPAPELVADIAVKLHLPATRNVAGDPGAEDPHTQDPHTENPQAGRPEAAP
jgi:gluconokinase